MRQGRTAWGQTTGWLAALAIGASLMGAGACGGSGANGGPVVGGSGPNAGGPGNGAMPHPPWTELSPAAVSVEGGWADSAGGQAQPGGTIHIVSAGMASFDPSAASGATPNVPAASGQALDANALKSDVHLSGSVQIGDVTAGGSDPVRSITVDGGDIFVTGKLQGADLGGARQALTLNAPGGNVYVVGTVDTSGANGQSGGAITIAAQQAVVTGTLASAGGDGTNAGGAAGNVSVSATTSIAVTGTIDAFGGNAGKAAGTSGGAGGSLTLQTGGDVTLEATVRLRGGAATSTGADAHGGNGATLTIDGAGALLLAGTVDARGGFATASGGAIAGGTAGAIKIGESAPPASIGIGVPLALAGGKGGAVAGAGGTFALEAGGDIHVATQIGVDGGSISNGGSGDGGTAGAVTIEVKGDTGALEVTASGEIDLDGGESGGTGKAGGGGQLTMLTRDGDLSVAGRLFGRGGAARDSGGTGGLGAQFDLFSDNDHNGFGGNLTIEAGGVLDASGGSGTIGGSARNNGVGGSDVASFPDHIDEIAILLNSDGIHGTTRDGVLVNMGRVVAKGGVTGGTGGDVAFHGKAADGGPNPLEGDVETDGDGSGPAGQFRSE